VWDLGVRRRCEILRRFQQLLHEPKGKSHGLVTEESGKPYAESLVAELMVWAGRRAFCCETARPFLQPQPVPHGNLIMKAKGRCPAARAARCHRNYFAVELSLLDTCERKPCRTCHRHNAVVLKTLGTYASRWAEAGRTLHAAGVTADIFQVVIGDGATGSALVDSAVDKIVFTGSVSTGRRIAQAAARVFCRSFSNLVARIRPLSWKTPTSTLPPAAWSGSIHEAGQTCLSIERCYVHRSVHDRFVEGLPRQGSRLRVGSGGDPERKSAP